MEEEGMVRGSVSFFGLVLGLPSPTNHQGIVAANALRRSLRYSLIKTIVALSVKYEKITGYGCVSFPDDQLPTRGDTTIEEIEKWCYAYTQIEYFGAFANSRVVVCDFAS